MTFNFMACCKLVDGVAPEKFSLTSDIFYLCAIFCTFLMSFHVRRLPGLFENIFRPPSSGIGLQFYISIYNSIWLFVFVCVSYGIGACLTGQTPRLPFVGDAADQQVR